ncbi:molybdenum cofactor biosynthesis protein MoaE [Propioniciclava soli]|uniref:molybdenum cofactor biosynthesis protein MoaE n=1 Tax=Propioniciclava soli TaxID=2775081 RepID=UPI001E5910FF|nr:molybdenum cofactor biosynthesis protein MoaE [Propioniciclava soli]
MPAVHTAVTAEVLDADAHHAWVVGPSAGAVVAFHGVIRDHDPEAAGVVTGIDYTAHPDAPAILARLVEEVLATHDAGGEARVAVSHRVGHLGVGELALVCCVASAHRAEAFGVCGAVVEAVKAGLPIWKHQTEATGRRVWSGLGLAES